MTKAEFLHLRAGEQRWVLLSVLLAAAGTSAGVLSGLVTGSDGQEATAATLRAFRTLCDEAAQEEVTVDD